MGIFSLGLAFFLTWLGNVLQGSWFYIVVCIAVYVITSLIWGSVTATVVTNKGYYFESTKWFWIGIIFNELGFALACTKPDLNIVDLMNEHFQRKEEERRGNTNTGTDKKLAKMQLQVKKFKTVLPSKEWKCSCGRTNPSYVTTCLCGAEKSFGFDDDSDTDQKDKAKSDKKDKKKDN